MTPSLRWHQPFLMLNFGRDKRVEIKEDVYVTIFEGAGVVSYYPIVRQMAV